MSLKTLRMDYALEIAAFAGAGAAAMKDGFEDARVATDPLYNVYDATGFGDREIMAVIVPAVVRAADELYSDPAFSPPPDTVFLYDYARGAASYSTMQTLRRGTPAAAEAVPYMVTRWMRDRALSVGALGEGSPS